MGKKTQAEESPRRAKANGLLVGPRALTPRERQRVQEAARLVIERRREVLEALAKQ